MVNAFISLLFSNVISSNSVFVRHLHSVHSYSILAWMCVYLCTYSVVNEWSFCMCVHHVYPCTNETRPTCVWKWLELEIIWCPNSLVRSISLSLTFALQPIPYWGFKSHSSLFHRVSLHWLFFDLGTNRVEALNVRIF